MQIARVVLIALLFFSVGVASENLQERIDRFESSTKLFYSLCVDENSAEYIGKSTIESSDQSFNCVEQEVFLSSEYNSIENELEADTELLTGMCTIENESSLTEYNMESITAVVEKLSECPKDDESCLEDLYCNTFNSFVPGGASLSKGLYFGAKKIYEEFDLDINKSSSLDLLKKCTENKEGNCIYAAMRGVFDSVFTNFSAMWDIGKAAAKKGWEWIKSKFVDEDEIATEKMLVASQMDDSMIDQFMADPLAFLKKMAKAVYDMSVEGIKNNYGCEEWSGAPMISTCLTPMQNWECSNCSQKMNAVCGVIGFMGGEIVTSFLTGGMVGAAKVGISATSKVAMKGATKMSKLLKPMIEGSKAKAAIQTISKGFSSSSLVVTRSASKAWAKVKGSSIVQKVKLQSSNALDAAQKIGDTSTYKVLSAVPRATKNAISKYLELNNRAFILGAKGSEAAMISLSRRSKVLSDNSALKAALESEPKLLNISKSDPETIDIVFHTKEMQESVTLFLNKATPSEKADFVTVLETISKSHLPGERKAIADKLYKAINECAVR